jgi:hypothetical protein
MSNAYFRTMALKGSPVGGVDRSAKRINGVKVMQLGKVNDDRPWEVDDKTLAQLVQFGNAPNKGTKARFTHPSMSDDGFGKYLGRWQNFRRDGEAVLADIQLADSAFNTPSGDLGTYVMDLAEEDPEAFGVSAATMLAKVMQSKVPEGEVIPLRLDGLRAVDFVDDPAATRGGLFDMTSPAGLPALTSWIVDTHFADREPAEVVNRMCSFLSKHYGRDIMSEVLAGNAATESAPAAAPQVEAPAGQLSMEAAKPYLEAFGDRGAKWYLEGKPLADCFAVELAELKGALATKQAENEALQVKLDAALKASGESVLLSSAPKVELTDAQAKAKARAAELAAQGAEPKVAKWAAAFGSN